MRWNIYSNLDKTVKTIFLKQNESFWWMTWGCNLTDSFTTLWLMFDGFGEGRRCLKNADQVSSSTS